MGSRVMGMGLLVALAASGGAVADDGASKDGLALYNKECSVCHGVMTHATAAGEKRAEPRRQAVHLAMAPGTAVDIGVLQWTPEPDRIAVAPIYGPPLQGILGRTAGISERYTYSKAFLAKMDGVKWDEASLDRWMKSSQTMIPGSYMFYSQKSQEIRARIIEYLKAQ